MSLLILGLIVFLGLHSIRIVADDWRTRQVARIGVNRWKAIYSILAVIGLVLIIVGFVMARQHPVPLYAPPPWLRHLNALFMLIALILFPAARVPNNAIKAKLHHPQVLAVKTWAFGHLLATGMLHDVLLFGSFLLWAIVLFAVSRRRDRRNGTVYPPGTVKGTVIVIVAGFVLWALFAFWLHYALFGVNPLA
ncbi:NnrU family protein [Dyella monticola]|uniref:NnrU family protein n=1 Tax=Dyella monticola TaxID=1927958 RepID=A0A370WVX1_9GAMM|nr:NnrU family protein [Dyella monticola]RDS80269.1 NnrU family protein [Dyella monticola]